MHCKSVFKKMLNIPITEAACSDDAASDYMSVDSDDVNFIASETEILKDAQLAAKLQKKENEAFLESETISEESDPASIEHLLYDDIDDAENFLRYGTQGSNDSQSLYLSHVEIQPVEKPPVELPFVELPPVEQDNCGKKEAIRNTHSDTVSTGKDLTQPVESKDIKVNESDVPYEILQSMRDVWKKIHAQKLSKTETNDIYVATFEQWRKTFSETIHFSSYESLNLEEKNYVECLLTFCQKFFKRRMNRWNRQTTSEICVENYLIENMKQLKSCKFSEIII